MLGVRIMISLGIDAPMSIERQAKDWLIRLDGNDPLADVEKKQLKEWMSRSAMHREELARLIRFWNQANLLNEIIAPLESERHELNGTSAFISHIRSDDDMAKRLAIELERWGIHVAWMDRLITPGRPWTSELETAIAKSDLFFVLISRKSSHSQWVAAEIALAISLAEQGRLRVIPVLVDRDAEIPPLLSHIQALEFFDAERAQPQLDALVLSIQNDAITGDNRAADRQAQLRYIKASREALATEIAEQEIRRANLSSSFAGTWRLIASLVVGAMIGGIGGFLGKASTESDLTGAYRSILALTFGLGVLVTALVFLLTASVRHGHNPLRSRWERQ